MLNKNCIIIFLSYILSGCSAVDIVETNDPHMKIEQALLLINSNRPIPADKLIVQAIRIFKESNDSIGLVRAYRLRGDFLISSQVENNENFFNKYGFILDGKIYDNRHEKAIDYFIITKNLIKADKRNLYSALTQIHMKLAKTYSDHTNNHKEVCDNLETSKKYYNIRDKSIPDNLLVTLVFGHKSYNEFYKEFNTKHHCKAGLNETSSLIIP
ncbi:hypothetical protein MNBD_GAMMA10-1394 [hydrothermal vent metagenome]|uniref:Lipoprotein n=1 Tax=hydrothermal vent metagenome TaxID=652676 RepID=A0A3B0X975_9ZZZZ